MVSRSDLRTRCLTKVTPRRWAHVFWAHPGQPDGLVYRARHDPSKESVGIFDRAGRTLRFRRLGTLVADEARLSLILNRYEFAIVE